MKIATADGPAMPDGGDRAVTVRCEHRSENRWAVHGADARARRIGTVRPVEGSPGDWWSVDRDEYCCFKDRTPVCCPRKAGTREGWMSRTQAVLPGGPRLSDYLSIGVLAQVYPIPSVREALASCGRESRRQRDLPAAAMVYYVVALGLFRSVSAREVLRCLLEGQAKPPTTGSATVR